ncbi:MAG TPA: ATP-binding protein [Flavobacteriales bacterium]|jgi:PAS domain S-box-containing protein|nr:ATP-binding protein [Flavobacteriales bacterium]
MQTERIKVLYVDDEEGNLMAFRATFRRDFDVYVATNAQDAIALLEKENVHVVISDQRMPRLTGSEFLGKVKARWPRTVRFLLTGFSDIEAVVEAINEGGIHAYITKPWDPTDLKLRIEQAYEVHALRDEKERLFNRYRQVFDASGDPIVIVDDNGRIRDANGATQRWLGMDRTALITSQVDRFVKDMPALVRSMRSMRSGTTFANVEVTVETPSGRTMDCLITATYLGTSHDGSVLFQTVLKDITDRKQEEFRLRKLNSDLDRRVALRTKQLMDALDDLGAFSYSVAHDLRSPLKNLKVLSEHLSGLTAVRGDEEERDLSGRIHRGAARLIALVDDLLRFARTDSHQLQREDVDVADTVRGCVQDLILDRPDVEFVLPEPGAAVLQADRAMLQVVFNNLLGNALKFTRGRENPRIEVGHRVDGDHLVIWVKDNGVGFDSLKGDQVFGVFKRLHRADQFEGTGIGLAIVQRIMQKHAGSCWAEGKPGQGATLYLRFPSTNSLRMAG